MEEGIKCLLGLAQLAMRADDGGTAFTLEMREPLAPEIAKIKKICCLLTGKEINQIKGKCEAQTGFMAQVKMSLHLGKVWGTRTQASSLPT